MKFFPLTLIILSTFNNVYSMENNIQPNTNNEIKNDEKKQYFTLCQQKQDSNNNHLNKKIKREQSEEEYQQELKGQYNELNHKLFNYSYNDLIYSKMNSENIQNIIKNKPTYYDIIYSIENIFDKFIRNIDYFGKDDTLQNKTNIKRIKLNNIIEFAKIFDKFCFTKEKKEVTLYQNNRKDIKKYIGINKKLNYDNTLQIGKFCNYLCIQLIKLESQVIKMILASESNNKEIFSNLDSTLHNLHNKLVSLFESTYNKNNNINSNLKHPENNFVNTIINNLLTNIKSGITIELSELQYYDKKIDQKLFEIHNIVINALNKLKEKFFISQCEINNIYCINFSSLLKLSLRVDHKDKFELQNFFTGEVSGHLTYDFINTLIDKINILYKIVYDASQKQFSMVHKVNYGNTTTYYCHIVQSILSNIKRSMISYLTIGNRFDILNRFSNMLIDINFNDVDALSEVIDKIHDFKNEFFPRYIDTMI